VRLNALALGTAGNPTAFGSFSYDWEFDSDFKKARRGIVGAQRFVSGLGWNWNRDEGRRLANASSTTGDWTYVYGPADEFTQIVDSNAGTSDLPTSGPEGRLEKKGTTTYTYDTEGRRIEDARFLYTWDFRSRLVRAESKQAATQGEVVDYAYDALGRLLSRTHRGALPSGSLDETKRPFKAQRGYLWDGDTLLTETSYNFDGGIVSRKDHVPGPGPDQTYQIKADGRTFSLFKDEQGNPIGLFEETVSGKANLLARFLYTPYGDLHLEAGPEPRKAEFKTGKATLGPVTQTVDDLSVTGSLELTTTLALAAASYDALKVETFDSGTSTWKDVPRAELTLGVDTNPELLILFRTDGWKKNTRYRFRVTTGLKDDFGRNLQLPDDVAVELQIPLDITTVAPIYIRTFKLGYDTAKAAANELGGAFTGGLSLGFTGAAADPFSGLLYLRNRWYDPGSGTWLTTDPAGEIDSVNLYGYVGLRPQMGTDPLGLSAWSSIQGYVAGITEEVDPSGLLPEVEAIDAGYPSGTRDAEDFDASKTAGKWTLRSLTFIKSGLQKVASFGVRAAIKQEAKDLAKGEMKSRVTGLVSQRAGDAAEKLAESLGVDKGTAHTVRTLVQQGGSSALRGSKKKRPKPVAEDPAGRRPKARKSTMQNAYEGMPGGPTEDTRSCPECGSVVTGKRDPTTNRKDMQLDHTGERGPWVARQERARREGWTRERVNDDYQEDVRGICTPCNERLGGELGAARRAAKDQSP
jgi:RHS repeat-associated protein